MCAIRAPRPRAFREVALAWEEKGKAPREIAMDGWAARLETELNVHLVPSKAPPCKRCEERERALAQEATRRAGESMIGEFNILDLCAREAKPGPVPPLREKAAFLTGAVEGHITLADATKTRVGIVPYSLEF